MAEAGWITLSRDITNHWLWSQPRRLKMWMQMVFMAYWKAGYTVNGTKRYEIKRGQFSTNMRQLARDLGCTKQTVLTFLQLLEEEGMITREMPGMKFTIITIIDYDRYQGKADEKNQLKKSKKIIENESKTDLKNDEKLDIPDTEKDDKNDGNGQVSRRKLDRKLDHLIKNKEERISSSSYAHAREENSKTFEEIKREKNFWTDSAKGLGMDPENPETIPKLHELGEKYIGEQLSKGKDPLTPDQMRDHLFNWLRRNQEKQQFRDINNTTNSKTQYKKTTNNNGKTNIDSRRGVDAPSEKGQRISKGRF